MTHFLGLRTAGYSVGDLAAARAWYVAVLGIEPYFDQPFYVGFNVGGFELGLVPDDTAGPTRRTAGVAYWGVVNAQSAFARLISLGATSLEPIQDVGDGIKIGAVHDPFGNVLGVIENPHFAVVPAHEAIIYSVTAEMEAGSSAEWLAWMRKTHIPEVLATGCFTGCRISERQEPATASGHVTYVLDYSSPSQAELTRYRERFAPMLQQVHAARFGASVRASRTVRTLIA